jgi:uncharacterized membrane-anchored protein
MTPSAQTVKPPFPGLNKVPEITLIFWLIKMMSTTVGETAADYLDFKLHFGLINTTVLMCVPLLASLWIQIRSDRYRPYRYWMAVVSVSVVGTLFTDALTDILDVPLLVSTGAFSVLLALTFGVWYQREQTLSIHHIDSLPRELFYWGAILLTFALGTAAGDWMAEEMETGYANAALLFGGAIVIIWAAWRWLRANATTCFWLAYILTRPLGAACGDWLAHPVRKGGLGLGVSMTSLVFLVVILGLVVWLDRQQKQQEATVDS